jgi:hypothetical protein
MASMCMQGLTVSVSVAAEAFTVTGHREYNEVSDVFLLEMI